MDFPQQGVAMPTYISSLSGNAAPADGWGNIANAVQLTWVANLAIYIPFYLMAPYPIRRVFWANGSSAVAANCDFGIYSFSGDLVYSSGSTARSGSSVLQYVTVSPELWLPSGRYYMAYANDTNNPSTAFGDNTTATRQRTMGVLQQATAFPLPGTMTPAVIANALFPIFGFTQT
jgi:hypothetical protein